MASEDTLQTTTEDDAAEAEMNAGFQTETVAAKAPAAKTDPPAPAAAPAPKPVTKEDPETAAPAPAAAAAPKLKPEYVRITKDELASLQADAARTPELEKKIDRALGTLGSVEERIIKKLQAATPKGDVVELPDDVVDELKAEFPEIAELVRTALKKAMVGKRGTGTGTEASGIDDKTVKEIIRQDRIDREAEALDDAHPEWKNIVGFAESQEKADPNNPFRKWLATQPAEYQTKINSTFSAAVISRAIDKFKTDTAKPPAQKKPDARDDSRRGRIQGAIQPKGDGGQPGPRESEEDQLVAGFKSG